MPIIAICGFKGSGKDTFASELITRHGYVKLSFAGALKDVLSAIFNWDRVKLEGCTPEDRAWRETVDHWWANNLNMPGLTPRRMLEQIGTELFRRQFHPDIWMKALERRLSAHPRIVITDCRFSNEIALVRRSGGILIHVARNLPAWFDAYAGGCDCSEADALHVSETEWIRQPFDITVDNSGTLDRLAQTADDIARNYSKNEP